MMLPATTSCPPNFFTPRRRPAESRPLREEPPAFLCAIVYAPRFSGSGFSRRGLALGLGCLRLGRLLLGRADRHDLQDRVVLTVAVLAAVVMTAALLENDDLVGLRLRD